MLLGGDWRQSLPVVPQGTRGDVFISTVQQSYLWDSIRKYKLTVNERIKACGNDLNYAAFVLKMGDGRLLTYDATLLPSSSKTNPSLIRIPDDLLFESDNLED